MFIHVRQKDNAGNQCDVFINGNGEINFQTEDSCRCVGRGRNKGVTCQYLKSYEILGRIICP